MQELLIRAGTIIGILGSAATVFAVVVIFARVNQSWGKHGELLSSTAVNVHNFGLKLDDFSKENKHEHGVIRDRLEKKIDEVSQAFLRKNENEHTHLAKLGEWQIKTDGRLGQIEHRLEGIERRVGPQKTIRGGRRKGDPV